MRIAPMPAPPVHDAGITVEATTTIESRDGEVILTVEDGTAIIFDRLEFLAVVAAELNVTITPTTEEGARDDVPQPVLA